MGNKNLLMLKTHIESINICFLNDFVYGNMLWALASLRVFFCNYVLYSLGLILRYIFRFQVVHQTDRNQFQDSEIDGFAEELANLMFPSCEDFHVAGEERGETENSVLVATVSDVLEESKSREEETEASVSKETDSDIHEDTKKREGETDCSVSKEKDSDIHEDGKEIEGETKGSVFMETVSDVHEDVKKIDENETESSVSMQGRMREEEGLVVMDTATATTISKCQFVSTKDISGFKEEPTNLTFSFQEFYTGPNVSGVSDNAFASITGNIANKEFSELNSKEGLVVAQEEEESVEEQRRFTSNSTSGRFRFESEAFGGSDSSDDDYLHGEEAYRNNSLERNEETMWEEKFDELDSDEEDEDDLEWEHDELVEQLRLELRNARQGGLATILEEEEEEDKETESPKIVEDLKPLIIEEKVEYKDHIVEIQKVYKSYAEKMRKLDILNYQTMHAIGLLQLKDPLKLMLMPKSTVQGAKPLIPQNLWPRKAPKHTSDPMLKFVHELHRDLELVYVGQVCLSWEILCWQHKKTQELKQYDSQWPRRYNLVAGEFQLFQVLMQRFIENEPFQGPRIQNYVKNRCVIRNLLHVPAIKDDNMKDKKKIKWGTEEDAISIGSLAEIIKESMRVFWEFVRADKDYGNVILKVSHQIGTHVKDPAISDLLVDIRTQLHKKERKLKDIVRCGSCIVRRFQRHNEDQIQLDHEQLIAQVGLRLISRVVNMKNLRKDQLIWCNEKLNRIKFVGRKIQVEPSFLLFPC